MKLRTQQEILLQEHFFIIHLSEKETIKHVSMGVSTSSTIEAQYLSSYENYSGP